MLRSPLWGGLSYSVRKKAGPCRCRAISCSAAESRSRESNDCGRYTVLCTHTQHSGDKGRRTSVWRMQTNLLSTSLSAHSGDCNCTVWLRAREREEMTSKSTTKTVVSIHAMRCDSTHIVMLSLQSASQSISCSLVMMPRCMVLEATTSLFNKKNLLLCFAIVCLMSERRREREREKKREENKKERSMKRHG